MTHPNASARIEPPHQFQDWYRTQGSYNCITLPLPELPCNQGGGTGIKMATHLCGDLVKSYNLTHASIHSSTISELSIDELNSSLHPVLRRYRC
jgi:hypothetical protein